MTPAVKTLQRAGLRFHIHEYVHQPGRAYGDEAAQMLGLALQRVFKTLVVSVDGDCRSLAVALVPVAAQLDLRRFAAALQVKKVGLASVRDAERATGYVAGGISPIGQRRRLPTVLDHSALTFDTIYVSGGRRGLEIELAPANLMALCGARAAAISK